MSNVTQFFEQIGSDARMRDAAHEKLDAALRSHGIDPALSSAIIAGDPKELERLLGISSNTCCLIEPVETD